MVLAFVIGATLSVYAIASFVKSTSADTFVEVCVSTMARELEGS